MLYGEGYFCFFHGGEGGGDAAIVIGRIDVSLGSFDWPAGGFLQGRLGDGGRQLYIKEEERRGPP